MFKYFRTNLALQDRIHDLEGQIENLIGANNILTTQLNLAQSREANLLEKIFDITGVNKQKQVITSNPKMPDMIQLAKKGTPWAKVRANLEMKAQEEYWNNKNQKQDENKLDSSKTEDKEFNESNNSNDSLFAGE
jgi:TolA-binding protein